MYIVLRRILLTSINPNLSQVGDVPTKACKHILIGILVEFRDRLTCWICDIFYTPY